jgi:hypothetical protein
MTTDSACKYVGKVQGFGTGYNSVSVVTGADNVTTKGARAYEMKASDTTGFTAALNNLQSGESAEITLTEGTYTMPAAKSGAIVTIKGTKDTVIDVTKGYYADSMGVTFEGVTINSSLSLTGSDYSCIYSPNATFINCTINGEHGVGRNGAKYIGCTFNLSKGQSVWTYENNVTFEECTFNSAGKALLVYAHGTQTNEAQNIIIKDCIFNATAGDKAGAIANQNCAAVEIDNSYCSFNVTIENITYTQDNFSGAWRIKTCSNTKTIIVNDTEYTTIAIDGKTMTIDANKNVTVNQ